MSQNSREHFMALRVSSSAESVMDVYINVLVFSDAKI